jgi:hypothetical protein
MYSTYEVHVIKHFDDTEVIDDLPLEQARLIAASEHGVVVERVHYDFGPRLEAGQHR